jgi:hypothetical protein
MSVDRYLRLKAAIVASLDRAVPLPNVTEDWQDRQMALVDALSGELAAWLAWKNPGVTLPEQFVVDTIASFAADILIPFTVAGVRDDGRRHQVRH